LYGEAQSSPAFTTRLVSQVTTVSHKLGFYTKMYVHSKKAFGGVTVETGSDPGRRLENLR